MPVALAGGSPEVLGVHRPREGEGVKEGKVDVVERLKRISLKKREEMRRFIVRDLLPGLVYGDPSSEFVRFRDAFGIVMVNVIDLITETAK